MERTRANHEAPRMGPAGGGDFTDVADDPAAGQITVSQGVFCESLPLAGETVAGIRERIRENFADLFDMGPAGGETVSVAVIDGQPVDDNTVVQAGEFLTFVMHAGVKGLAPIPSRRRYRSTGEGD